ncbi:MAG: calcium-translocating P-type ATPase, PMCA-type [Lachnospiraceae bacterium]|nr:calcium-translocating P-type ATPase, PMCA-type [Lachnospiraceae bacterium]
MEWHEKTLAEAEREAGKDGLSSAEAAARKKKYGGNEWGQMHKKPLAVRFFEQWKDFMILTLVCAAVISAAASYFNGTFSLVDPLVILSIITFNACLGVAQESRAEKSLEALKRLSAPTARVKRDGVFQVIPASEVVPGDIVRLEAGNYVPADGRLLEAVNLKAEESSLTGESLPVEKDASAVCGKDTPAADRKNMVMAATMIVYGRGCAVVTATGMHTEAGKIARQVMEEVPPPTPLQKRLDETGKKLGIGALFICVMLFAVGAVRHFPLFDMFMVSVSLAVAAIPEGLSAVVTVMLSLGVRRMVKNHAVIRRLPAVETLGSTTVICSDKTGTLTKNRMTVRRLLSADGEETGESSLGQKILAYGTLCGDSSEEGGKIVGEATEKAIAEAAKEAGIHKADWERTYPRADEIPFDSERKRMATLHRGLFGSGGILVKGAPDVLLARCEFYETKDGTQPMTGDIRRRLTRKNEEMAGQALRVIAVAGRKWRPEESGGKKAYEKNLVFYGLIGMMDPPRPEAAEAVRVCRKAGIRTVMITGDHIQTASAVARELKILEPGDLAVTGQELSTMSEEELLKKISRIRVFARVSPEHKVRVVKAMQRAGEVTAMTGDGVNDAPALKAADIGCAMGLSGTDVAKNTADLVLTDDNFATIVAAVKEGRVIYANIRKAIHFLLATNIGELVSIFMAVMMGLPSPLLAVQLLWVNLVTDSLPAIAIGMEPAEEGIMNQKPAVKDSSIFAGGMGFDIAAEGCLIGFLTLGVFIWSRNLWGLPVGRTMAFGVLSLSELFHGMNMRSGKSLFQIGFFSNRVMTAALAVCVGLQAAVMAIPAAANVFAAVPLNGFQWAAMFVVSLAPVAAMEMEKAVRNRVFSAGR